jgi:hypothetical protein
MKRKKLDRETQAVVNRVLPLVPTGRKVAKEDFEVVFGKILACVDEKTGAGMERIAQVKEKVLTDIANGAG